MSGENEVGTKFDGAILIVKIGCIVTGADSVLMKGEVSSDGDVDKLFCVESNKVEEAIDGVAIGDGFKPAGASIGERTGCNIGGSVTW
mmetsp:Transcript_22280/g.33685  ORF Transcript_22280/g.33685 Transcript_22280/m.33685 type:complete len:88 (+) Transcript_22280:163-426(+)